MKYSIMKNDEISVMCKTNYLWNSKSFNNQKLVGPIISLLKNIYEDYINKKAINEISDKFELKYFIKEYFNSGERRKALYFNESEYLQTRNRVLTYQKGTKYNYALDYSNGRDKEFINCLIDEWFECLLANGYDISKDFAKRSVYQRLFIDTYNGFVAEEMLIKYLKTTMPKTYKIKHSSAKIDNLYNVDIEITDTSVEDKIICGIQLKPISYKNKFKKGHKLNAIKEQKYKELTNAPVHYVYYEKKEKKTKFYLSSLTNI